MQTKMSKFYPSLISKVMSFATVVPYACIVDGPRALRWWGGSPVDSGGFGAGPIAVAGIDDGHGGVEAPGMASLALYLSVSGVLLFLHSAVSGVIMKVGEGGG